MDLSNISRRGLEQALQKALNLLPPEGVEEVVAAFPERLPAIDHTQQKASQALGITEESFNAIAKTAGRLAKLFTQEGEQLRSVHVESILSIWKGYGEREKALFAVLLAEAVLHYTAKSFTEKLIEVAIHAKEARDAGQ